MKKIILFLMLLLPSMAFAQKAKDGSDKHYLAGAVPTVNGMVQFDKQYYAKNKTKAAIMDSLRNFIQTQLIDGPDQLPQARITEITPDSGIIAASIEEYMYFKRTNWQIHRVHFYYQLIFKVKDGEFTATMRNLHYRYDPEVTAGDFDEDRCAEKWITDDAALTKNGTKLARISGKFRTHTIDRKNEIFRNAGRAVGVKFRRKVVEVDDED